ncbi:hypothetical protein PanWU01x14_074930 [Parasponia andersonii]|uniref:Uncharacterized protein n=1 Tax=Parasponia andersonii TaxID=3476 RepID=A0A2P5DDI0_PARAD|nr:hypothetical protein PanWU01x14_074930 [Parasponia andersonii]
MMGSVRLKSKSAAFSISSAKDGGARAKEVAAARERDLRVEDERECNWVFEIFGILCSEIWAREILGLEAVAVAAMEGGDKGLEEAMIMLAMADSDVCFSGCLFFVSVGDTVLGDWRRKNWGSLSVCGISQRAIPSIATQQIDEGVVVREYCSGTSFTRVSSSIGLSGEISLNPGLGWLSGRGLGLTDHPIPGNPPTKMGLVQILVPQVVEV